MSIYIHIDQRSHNNMLLNFVVHYMRLQKKPAYNAPINVKSQMWGI